MIVSELIDKLHDCDPNATAYIGYESVFENVEDVSNDGNTILIKGSSCV